MSTCTRDEDETAAIRIAVTVYPPGATLVTTATLEQQAAMYADGQRLREQFERELQDDGVAADLAQEHARFLEGQDEDLAEGGAGSHDPGGSTDYGGGSSIPMADPMGTGV